MFSDVHDMHPRDWFILVELHNAYLFISFRTHMLLEVCLSGASFTHSTSFSVLRQQGRHNGSAMHLVHAMWRLASAKSESATSLGSV